MAQFFSTPKRVNRDKKGFATKQRKLHKREILQQNSIKCDKTSQIVHNIHFVMMKEMTDQFRRRYEGWPVMRNQEKLIRDIKIRRGELSLHVST